MEGVINCVTVVRVSKMRTENCALEVTEEHGFSSVSKRLEWIWERIGRNKVETRTFQGIFLSFFLNLFCLWIFSWTKVARIEIFTSSQDGVSETVFTFLHGTIKKWTKYVKEWSERLWATGNKKQDPWEGRNKWVSHMTTATYCLERVFRPQHRERDRAWWSPWAEEMSLRV